MENIIGFIGVGSAIGFSFVMALGLEWLSLRALMFLMPGRAKEVQSARPSALAEMAAGPKQMSRWASFGYPKDATGRQIGPGGVERHLWHGSFEVKLLGNCLPRAGECG